MINITLYNKKISYNNIFIANTFFERLKGLMFVNKTKSFGLLFKNCSSVHTCFMKFNLDIFCLDKNFKVIKIYKNIVPFRFIFPSFKTYHILEMPSNIDNNICIDDILTFVK